MKNFWPHRSKAKGFSIENLASKYREKISIISSNKTSTQFSDDTNIKLISEVNINIPITSESNPKGHWANRDFSEYREAA